MVRRYYPKIKVKKTAPGIYRVYLPKNARVTDMRLNNKRVLGVVIRKRKKRR